MSTVLLGAIANIILDPIFIFLFDMGVRGAALATILSQALSALWVLRFLCSSRAILRLRLKNMRLEAPIVKRITGLGLSGFTMSCTNSLVQIACNASLQQFGGDLYVGIMTVINSVREIISMPISGVTSGAQPVLGYNYGAGKGRRVKEGIRFMTIVCVGYSLFVWPWLCSFLRYSFVFSTKIRKCSLLVSPACAVLYGIFLNEHAVYWPVHLVALGKSKQPSSSLYSAK